jgi:hypothetical protein
VLPTAQTGQARTTFGEMPHSSRAQYQRDLPYRTVNDTDSPLRTNVNNLDSCICDFSLTNRAMSSQCFLKALFWCIPFHTNKHHVCSAGLTSTQQCGQWYGGSLGQKVPVTSQNALSKFRFRAPSTPNIQVTESHGRATRGCRLVTRVLISYIHVIED